MKKEGGAKMLDYRFVKLIETIGCINDDGERIYGTAALLHVLHKPVSSFRSEDIERGRAYIEKLLAA